MSAKGTGIKALDTFDIPNDAPPIFARLYGLIVVVAQYLIALIRSGLEDRASAEALGNLGEQVYKLSDRVYALEDTHTTKPVLAASAHTRQAPSSSAIKSNRNQRCTRCHAHGHSQAECKSSNPDIVKKRVAKNKRAHKQLPKPPVLHYLSPPNLSANASAFSSFAAPPLDSRYLALAADAAELRRRADQSSRDKKRARRLAHAPSTSK
jgi:hypothetical protein